MMKNDARIEIICLDLTDHQGISLGRLEKQLRLKSNRKVCCLIPLWSETAE